MSTTASFVIPHPVTTGSNPSLHAMQLGAARNADQHALVMVSKGKVGGGGKNKKNKNKNSKKYSSKSAMKKRFSKRFRRSLLKRKTRKIGLYKKNKKALYGGATTTTTDGDKLTIPSFRQTSEGGAKIINQLAGNHAQTLAYSEYDNQAPKPVS